MKLKAIHETLLAVTGASGRNSHTHRYDPSKSGETTVDDYHYHKYRQGDKETSGVMAVPADADPGPPHEHYLPTEMIMGQIVPEDMQLDEIAPPKEKIIHFLKQLANPDLQRLTPNAEGLVGQQPKANVPLSISIEEDEYGNIKIKGLYWNTSRGTAIRTMQIKLEAMLEKLDIGCQYIYIRSGMMHDEIITDLPIPDEDYTELGEVHVLINPYGVKADLRSDGSGDHETGTG